MRLDDFAWHIETKRCLGDGDSPSRQRHFKVLFITVSKYFVAVLQICLKNRLGKLFIVRRAKASEKRLRNGKADRGMRGLAESQRKRNSNRSRNVRRLLPDRPAEGCSNICGYLHHRNSFGSNIFQDCQKWIVKGFSRSFPYQRDSPLDVSTAANCAMCTYVSA